MVVEADDARVVVVVRVFVEMIYVDDRGGRR